VLSLLFGLTVGNIQALHQGAGLFLCAKLKFFPIADDTD